MTRRLLTGLGLVLAIALSGCGGGDDSDGIASATGNGAKASSSPSAEALTDEERQVKFAQCMRDQGIDMPDPEINEGRVAIRMPEGTDPKKVQAAMEKCKQYLPNGGEARKANPEQLEQARQFAKCMRENGVPSFPDPDANGGIRIQATPGGDMNPDSPTFKAAQEKCDKYRPSTGPGGGTGGTTKLGG
jgi:PBP/GOBP family